MIGFKHIFLAELALMCTMTAGAQLDTSVGGSLSSPLDANGPSSAAAPTISGAIEPGANNLLAPDDRQQPYDSIGASVVATRMSPSVTQFYPLMFDRMPYQLDPTVKDAAYITGQPNVIFANIFDIIARRPDKLASSPTASSFGPSPALRSSALLRGKMPPGMNADLPAASPQQSFWTAGSSDTGRMTAGGSNAMQAINSLNLSGTTVQQSNQSPDLTQTSLKNLMKGNSLSTKKPADMQNGGANSDSSRTDKTTDYSRSPLEAAPGYGDQRPTLVADSPFENLDTYSFLNPDIALSSPLHSLPRRGKLSSGEKEKLLAASRSGQEFSASRTLQEYSMRLKDREMRTKYQGMSPAQVRLRKLYSGTDAVTKPKWHNPILQQMETESNPNRQ